MKYLILLIVLIGCGEVTFEVNTNYRKLKSENFTIKDENGVIEQGALPFTITSDRREVLTAKFNTNITNFAGNHPQCNCIKLSSGYYECTETFEVDGSDWNIAE